MTCEVELETCYDDQEECYFEGINVKLACNMSDMSAWLQDMTV